MDRQNSLFTPVLIGGCAIILISFAIRASFGVFQIPIADEFGWLRAEFSMAIAIQNLAWGVGQPLFGAIAEKFGDRKAILLGVGMYVVGLVVSAYAITPGQHQLLEILVGFGIAGTGFGVILAMVARASTDENRSMTLGVATAMGSAGQIVGPPLAEALLGVFPWQSVFLIFAGLVFASLLFLPLLRAPERAAAPGLDETMAAILGKAIRDPSFTLIFIGFFSCGYQLGFITAHFPAFITEFCGPIVPGSFLHSLGVTTTSGLGAMAIAVIGAANIGGTLAAAYLGKTYSKKLLLAAIYTGRTIAAAAFIMLPMTPLSVIVFSAVMGSLWLATVPLTSGLVGYIYGLRYMGTLYGIVFFSHQLGSFMGVWLGGELFDATGNYTAVWWVGVGVGALSAIIHLPIKEIPLGKRAPLAA
ncbi:MFS transporter [Gymnodinialimonas ceratoperidinii]|uniref:MFS transporter n=1 Tax=Gymnodinialimonas ceratoperidinii TaxID=2856823 RepID=A0A8F6YAV7_9RHOB|nr:MFS transporter [Gymnodinialimonas ceratoperidinii]QXT39923.1 MFS transporter [Gymnodinialimonas ceratoperidinii]